MEIKICRKCGQIKNISDYYFHKTHNTYLNVCKQCIRKRRKETYNAEKRKQESQKYYAKYREEILKRNKKWRDNNQDKIIEYRKVHRKERIAAAIKSTKKYRQDSLYVMKDRVRNLINKSFRRNKFEKKQKTEQILGCKWEYFYSYILKTFETNYGYKWDGKELVHIDHIIPLSSANTEEDILKLCHYTNLQLLKAKDNLKKGTKH